MKENNIEFIAQRTGTVCISMACIKTHIMLELNLIIQQNTMDCIKTPIKLELNCIVKQNTIARINASYNT